MRCNIRTSDERHRFRQAEASEYFLGLSSFRINLGKHEAMQSSAVSGGILRH
jgi:hypothetical protein